MKPKSLQESLQTKGRNFMHYPGHIEFFDVDDQESGAQDDDNLPVLMLYIGIVALLLIYVAVTLWPQG
jgi:hypothetical protein